jgi:hypothetical protein
MPDTIEQQDIRGLDIDKAVKGFALVEYIFKTDCMQATTSGDSIRWYQETANDLTATSPQDIEKMPLSTPATLETSWTRRTSYVREYMTEVFISEMDIQSADIDVIARQLLRLTRAVVKKVDTRIFNVVTEDLSPSTIQTFTAASIGGAKWDAASYAGNPIKDLLHAKYLIENQGYDTSNLVAYLNPLDARNLIDWLIAGKGSSIPQFASEKVRTGTLMNLLGITIKVSNNVTNDYCVIFVPQTAVTWKTHTATTSRMIEEAGIGRKIRVWERGEAILTDPKAVVLITDINT